MEPEEIRARAKDRQANGGGGGQRLGGAPAGPAPRTPSQGKKEKKRPIRNGTSSSEEDEKPYAGWDSDSEVELMPVAKHKKRQLATPEATPLKKKAKAIPIKGLPDPEHNPFHAAPAADAIAAALTAEDPFPALHDAVQDTYRKTQNIKEQLQRSTERNQYLEGRVAQLEQEKGDAEEQSRLRGLRIEWVTRRLCVYRAYVSRLQDSRGDGARPQRHRREEVRLRRWTCSA